MYFYTVVYKYWYVIDILKTNISFHCVPQKIKTNKAQHTGSLFTHRGCNGEALNELGRIVFILALVGWISLLNLASLLPLPNLCALPADLWGLWSSGTLGGLSITSLANKVKVWIRICYLTRNVENQKLIVNHMRSVSFSSPTFRFDHVAHHACKYLHYKGTHRHNRHHMYSLTQPV